MYVQTVCSSSHAVENKLDKLGIYVYRHVQFHECGGKTNINIGSLNS